MGMHEKYTRTIWRSGEVTSMHRFSRRLLSFDVVNHQDPERSFQLKCRIYHIAWKYKEKYFGSSALLCRILALCSRGAERRLQ